MAGELITNKRNYAERFAAANALPRMKRAEGPVTRTSVRKEPTSGKETNVVVTSDRCIRCGKKGHKKHNRTIRPVERHGTWRDSFP